MKVHLDKKIKPSYMINDDLITDFENDNDDNNSDIFSLKKIIEEKNVKTNLIENNQQNLVVDEVNKINNLESDQNKLEIEDLKIEDIDLDNQMN